MKRDQEGNYKEITWEQALQEVAEKLKNTQPESVSAIIGEFSDCESIVALKDLYNSLNCDNFEVRTKENLPI